MIRHVIFDLDGTLVDSCAVCVDILSEILIERGSDHVIDAVEARRHMSRGGQDMVAALLAATCLDPAADLADFRARYQHRRTPLDTIFPGVAEGLARMHAAGLILSICSNKPQNLCEQVLKDTGLAGYFTVVVGMKSGLRPKPAPDLLEAVLAGLGAAANDCIFVGDSELDDEVAREARLPFHFMTYGYAPAEWVPHTGSVFDCFFSLTDVIVADRVHA